jgi:hypothetical protein
MSRSMIVATLAALCALPGCTAKIWTTGMADVPHNMKHRISHYGPDEYPVFVVAAAKGRTVGLDVRDRRTDVVVAGKADRRVDARLEPMRLEGRLGEGAYVAELRVDGKHVDTWPFQLAARPVFQDPMLSDSRLRGLNGQ